MLSAFRNGSLIPTPASHPVNRLSTVFDRLFHEDFFAPLATTTSWSVLPCSTWEDDDHIYVEADTPGMTDKDLEVSLHAGELIIQGERKCERKGASYDTRSYGRFEQRIRLPAFVDANKVEARLANGVLSVTIPKSEEARPRKIAVRTQ